MFSYAVHCVEIFQLGKWAGFDDAVRGDLADAGEFHQLVAGGVVGVDLFAWGEAAISLGEFDLGGFIPFLFPLLGQMLPIRGGPCAEAFFRGLEFEILKGRAIFLGSDSAGRFPINPEGAGVA